MTLRASSSSSPGSARPEPGAAEHAEGDAKAAAWPQARATFVEATRRRELAAGLLTAGVLAVIEMGPALAKKGFDASDLEVALSTSARSIGLLCSVLTMHLACSMPRALLVHRLKTSGCVFLALVFFVNPGQALAFVALHGVATIVWHMSVPAQVSLWGTNFPEALRGRFVARFRRFQVLLTVAAALGLSIALDWSVGEGPLLAWFGESPFPAGEMVLRVVPGFAVIGIVGAWLYRSVPELPIGESGRPPGLRRTVGAASRILREDARFRRYEAWFFLLGFANIMTMPLVQIHAVDELEATWFDLALINVVVVHGTMAVTMLWWGGRVDRHRPAGLRAALNAILAVDLVVLAVAPTIEWVWFGRVFRGIAIGGGSLLWMLGALWFARRPEDAPVYSGIHTILTGVRWGIAPFVGIFLKDCFDGDSRPIFFIASVILVVTGIGMFRESRLAARTLRDDAPSGVGEAT